MTIRRNPFLKAESRINRIYGNTVILNFVNTKTTYDESSGDVAVERSYIQKEIAISEPHVFNESLEKNNLYFMGDVTFTIARYDLQQIVPQYRTQTIETCGIDMKNDFFSIAGQSYRIISIKPKTMWSNVPASYRVQVREDSQVEYGDI